MSEKNVAVWVNYGSSMVCLGKDWREEANQPHYLGR